MKMAARSTKAVNPENSSRHGSSCTTIQEDNVSARPRATAIATLDEKRPLTLDTNSPLVKRLRSVPFAIWTYFLCEQTHELFEPCVRYNATSGKLMSAARASKPASNLEHQSSEVPAAFVCAPNR